MGLTSKRKRQKKNCKKNEKKFKIIFFLQNIFFFKKIIKYQLIYRAIATTFFKHFIFLGFLAVLLAFEVFRFLAIFVVFRFFLVPPRGPPFTHLPQPTPKIKNIQRGGKKKVYIMFYLNKIIKKIKLIKCYIMEIISHKNGRG